MVKGIHNLVEDILQVNQVERVSISGYDFSLNCGLNFVVVSMRAWMIATAELLSVLFVRHVRIVEPVSGTKRHGSREVGQRTHGAVACCCLLLVMRGLRMDALAAFD